MKTCWRRVEDVFSVIVFRLPRRRGRRGFVALYYDKADNRFVISLYFGYVLHHCNAKKFIIYSSDVTQCVRLSGYRIWYICFDWLQHGPTIETSLKLLKIQDNYSSSRLLLLFLLVQLQKGFSKSQQFLVFQNVSQFLLMLRQLYCFYGC